MRRRSVVFGCAAALAARAARGAGAYTLRLNVPTPTGSATANVGLRFAAAVGRRTQGQITVEVYPNSQLATERSSVDALVSGSLDLSIIPTAFLQPLQPTYQVFDLLFLFKDLDVAFRVLDGNIGDEFFASLEPKGISGLAWGVAGFKQLETTSKTVVVPGDMKGLRIRIPSGAIYVATYQALGAIPVTIDLAETYTALTQRTVDGVDIALEPFTSAKYYTVVKHVAMSNHIFPATGLFASKRKLDDLPVPLQKIVRDEAKTVERFWRTTTAQQALASVEICKRNGVEFTTIDHAAFRKAVDPVYAMLQAKLGGDLIERIGRATGSG